MNHDQFQSVAVQCMAAIEEQLHILDLYAEPTESEVREFVDAIRRNVAAYQAAWEKYKDNVRQPSCAKYQTDVS